MTKTLIILTFTLLSVFNSKGVVALSDPSFESPTLNPPWEAEGSGGSISLNTNANYVHTGLQSAQVFFPSADNTGIHQNMAISPSDTLQTYKVSFWVLAPGFSAPIGVQACLWEFTPSTVVFNNGPYFWIPAGSTNWVHVTATLTTSAPDANVYRAVCLIAPQGSPKVSGNLWVDDASVTLVSTNPAPLNLTWWGGINANAWDLTTTNWIDSSQYTPSTYTNGSSVQFTDIGDASSPVLLTGTLSPSSVNVNATLNYTFSGPGNLSGGASLTKSGTGILTVANGGNNYTNNTTVQQGTFQLGANEVIPSGVGKGNLVLNGVLDLNGYTETVNNLSGSGTITNSSSVSGSFVIDNLTDSSFGGKISSAGGGSVTLVKTGPGMLVASGGPDAFSGQTIIKDGRILLQDGTLFGSGSVTISNGSYLMLWGTLGSGVMTNDFYLYSLGGNQGGQVKDSIFMDSGSGAMSLSGTIHLMSTADLGAYTNETLTVLGKVTGPGALYKGSPDVIASQGSNADAGLVVLANPANDFSGGLAVYGGILEIQTNGAGGSGNVLVSTNATLRLDATNALNPAASLALSDASSVVNLAYTGTQNIQKLSFDGGATFQVAGTWGAPGSAAVNQDSHFTGPGILNVATGSLVPPLINPVTIDTTDTNLVISVNSVSGHQYVLLSATNLIAPIIWTPVSTNSGTGGTLTNLVPLRSDMPARFYRYQAN